MAKHLTPKRARVAVTEQKTAQSAPTAHATSPAEWVHIDDLKPNPRNPRKHGQEVLRLAKTILRTTWGAPILAQRATRRIIGGHGRLEAAREILAGIEVDGELRGGHEHVFAHGAPGPGFVPVRWLDVSDAEADAMTLADNARGLQGEDDAVLIAQMAAQFGRESDLMRDVGYSAEALDRMIASAGDAVMAAAGAEAGAREGAEDASEADARDEEQASAALDRAAELRAKWQTAVGQLWLIDDASGVHRIVCGDSASAADVARATCGTPHVLLTDPPYGINANGMTLGIGKREFVRGAAWDSAPPDVVPFVDAALQSIVWGGNYFSDRLPPTNHWLCWWKKNDGRAFSEFELAWTNLGHNCRLLAHHWSGETKQHPTQKPLPVIAWCVSLLSEGLIFDPFLGSGTTVVAASKAGRIASGIEREPAYVAVCLERLAALGLKPRLSK